MIEVNLFLCLSEYTQKLVCGIQWSALSEALFSTNTEIQKLAFKLLIKFLG